jgi:hypothetical protein
MARLPQSTLQASGRWIVRGINLVSGLFGIGLTILSLYRTSVGAPIGPRNTLSLLLYVAILAFFTSGFFTIWIEHSKTRKLERENEDLRTPGKMVNAPQGIPMAVHRFNAIKGAHEAREKELSDLRKEVEKLRKKLKPPDKSS